MRAICGAIITAGALLGLGLTSIGFGTRYAQTVGIDRDSKNEIVQMHLWQMDRPLVFILVFLTVMAIIGLGIAILGLAYHHHRRLHELHHHHGVTGLPPNQGATGISPIGKM